MTFQAKKVKNNRTYKIIKNIARKLRNIAAKNDNSNLEFFQTKIANMVKINKDIDSKKDVVPRFIYILVFY